MRDLYIHIIYIYIYIYKYSTIQTHVYVIDCHVKNDYMYVCMYVCLYVCMYMYVCMYTYIHVKIKNTSLEIPTLHVHVGMQLFFNS